MCACDVVMGLMVFVFVRKQTGLQSCCLCSGAGPICPAFVLVEKENDGLKMSSNACCVVLASFAAPQVRVDRV